MTQFDLQIEFEDSGCTDVFRALILISVIQPMQNDMNPACGFRPIQFPDIKYQARSSHGRIRNPDRSDR